jgi:hypothetical protein
MFLRIKLIAKKLIDIRTAEFAGRQTDTMNNHQGNIRWIRSFVAIRRRILGDSGQPVPIN